MASALAFAASSAYRVSVIDRNERHIRKAFGYYMAPALLERLVDSREMPALGGEERDITVLFSDLAGFTAISEGTRRPRRRLPFLNDYFTELTEVIEATWRLCGALLRRRHAGAVRRAAARPADRRHAVEAALACQARLAGRRPVRAAPGGAIPHTGSASIPAGWWSAMWSRCGG